MATIEKRKKTYLQFARSNANQSKGVMRMHHEAMDMLLATSRTFFIPIQQLTPGLQEAVASSYLAMRAIDEIEDHGTLPPDVKANLLRSVSQLLKRPYESIDFQAVFRPYKALLPEVTLRLSDWLSLVPNALTTQVRSATARMADGMAEWVLKKWQIKNETDLDQYTFYVAGLVGLLLSEIWKWHENLETNREMAVGFGRGLQAVNMIRNRSEDLARGVDFFPDGWEEHDMFRYARKNLVLADAYSADMKPGPILTFCKIPLVLARGTLDSIEKGHAKLSRPDVEALVRQATMY